MWDLLLGAENPSVPPEAFGFHLSISWVSMLLTLPQALLRKDVLEFWELGLGWLGSAWNHGFWIQHARKSLYSTTHQIFLNKTPSAHIYKPVDHPESICSYLLAHRYSLMTQMRPHRAFPWKLTCREVGGIACLTSHSKLSPGSHWYDTFRMLPRPSRKDSKLSALLHIGSLWPESLHSSDYFLLSGESNHVTISTSLDRISLPPPPTLSVSLSLRPFLTSPPAFPRPPPTGRGLSFP